MKYIVVKNALGEYVVVWEHSALQSRDGYEKVTGGPYDYEEASDLASRLIDCKDVQES
ncbi:MAG: hypothetical protein BWY99_02118 [Synergistetes bacterium ADurb.BinA166]|nr:MAG: hypothetical protein BWY99_02118 [Synergistetes bacterium ADurb.BinA166]